MYCVYTCVRIQSDLQYFDDTFIIGTDIHGLEHLAVLPSAQFTHNLVVVLIAAERERILNEMYSDQSGSISESLTRGGEPHIQEKSWGGGGGGEHENTSGRGRSL